VKVGSFEVPGEIARRWLVEPMNVNGRPNSDVVRPWANGRDVTHRSSDTWIVDFGAMSEAVARLHSSPFGHVLRAVKPLRESNRDKQRREKWWLLGRSGTDYRRAVAELRWYIVTARVARHRVFVWMHASTVPDTRLVINAFQSDAVVGILQSQAHVTWALGQASRHGVGNDPTYNSQTCFETFPFPEGLTPNLSATSYADTPHAQAIAAAARELVEKSDLWLNPPNLVERVPEVVSGFPDRIVPRNARAAAMLKSRTLTNLYNTRGTPEGVWFDNLHRALDAAVAAAYGWPTDLSDDEVLSRLLALNLARSAGPVMAIG
jgi:hypothetical protein